MENLDTKETESTKSNPEKTAVISTRIPISLHDRLRKKHQHKGDTQKLLKLLLERYLDGRVLGISIQ